MKKIVVYFDSTQPCSSVRVRGCATFMVGINVDGACGIKLAGFTVDVSEYSVRFKRYRRVQFAHAQRDTRVNDWEGVKTILTHAIGNPVNAHRAMKAIRIACGRAADALDYTMPTNNSLHWSGL